MGLFNMADAYEKYADIFMSSMSGQMSGLTKAQFVARLKDKFPNEAVFVVQMEALTAQAEMQIAQAQAQLKPGQVLAVAYPIDHPRGPVH